MNITVAKSPDPSDHVGFLDGWRGLAITLVLYDHWFSPTTADSGAMGVDVFFCLSGLLMSNILYVRRLPLDKFYKRRISRVFPLFLLYVLTTFVAHWALTGQFSKTEFLATVTFLRTYIPEQPGIWDSSLPIGHLWSLNVEEHSYVLMGALTLLCFSVVRTAALLLAAGFLSTLTFISYIKVPGLEPHWGPLGTEIAAVHIFASAGYFLVRDRFSEHVRPWMPVGSFVIAALCYTDVAPWWAEIVLTPYLLAFTVNHLEQVPKAVLGLLSFPALRRMGVWSYSIYIWQQPFYLHRLHLPTGVALAGALLVALASFYWFETPARNWLNDNW